MNKITTPGANWLRPAGADRTACDGSQMQQLTFRSKILTLNTAIKEFNKRKRNHLGLSGVRKALFFARWIEGTKRDLTTYKANLEKRIFDELFSPDFFEIMSKARWLKGKKLETVLLSKPNTPLMAIGIVEEVDGRLIKTAADIYQWIEQNIAEIRALLKAIRKLNYQLPPESFAAVYEKQSKKIDIESVEDFYYEKLLCVGKPTFKKLQAFRTRVVAEFINLGLLRHAYKPTTEEVAEVDIKRLKRELSSDFKPIRHFRRYCAVFKKISRWEGLCLVIDIENYGKYICLHMSKMKADELLEFYKLEKLLTMINEAIMKLPPEELQAALEEQEIWREQRQPVKKQSQFQIQNVSQLIMEYNNHQVNNI